MLGEISNYIPTLSIKLIYWNHYVTKRPSKNMQEKNVYTLKNLEMCKALLWSEYLCPPVFIGWNSNAQSNGVKRQGLLEVIRS